MILDRNGLRLWAGMLMNEWVLKTNDPIQKASRLSFVKVWQELEKPLSVEPKWPIIVGFV